MNMIQKENFEFPLFELALFQGSLKSGDTAIQNAVKSLEENSLFLKLLLELLSLHPRIGFMSAIARCTDSVTTKIRNHINNNRQSIDAFIRFTEEEMTAVIIESFVKDLWWNLDQADIYSPYPIIIGIDKLEVLRNTIIKTNDFDSDLFWFRDQVISKLPKVVWLFTSREYLSWDKQDEWKESVINVHLNEFDMYWTKRYFISQTHNIPDYIDKIYSITSGVPIYLSICLDLLNYVDNPTELIERIDGKHEKLLNVYFENLSKEEQETLYILSCVEEWDEKFVTSAISHCNNFDFGYGYEQLVKKSYINCRNNSFELHQVIRDQFFAVCEKKYASITIEILEKIMHPEEYSLYYEKYLKCLMKIYQSPEELNTLIQEKRLVHLSRMLEKHDMNGINRCFHVINNTINSNGKNSLFYYVIGTMQITNLLSFKYTKAAKKLANQLLRKFDDVKIEVLNPSDLKCHIMELKAQALDMEEKPEIAFNLRQQICSIPSSSIADEMSKSHNLALSYFRNQEYQKALDILDIVISFRINNKL